MTLALRPLRALVLLAWSAAFVWLLASGEVYRYIGPRTYWVVVFGAIALGLVTLSHVVRPGATGRADRSDLITFGLLLLPLLVVVAVPRPSLGSLAASKKLSGGSITTGLARPMSAGGDIGIVEIEYASESEEYASSLGIVEGLEVELTGFVDRKNDLPAGHFALTRFSIYCCAADVVPHSVVVDGSELQSYDDDQWLTLAGRLSRGDDGFVLVAEWAKAIPEPRNPYIR